MGRQAGLCLAVVAFVGCTPPASPGSGDGERPLWIVGGLHLEVDPRVTTWDIPPGSRSDNASLQVCDGGEHAGWRRGCEAVGTDRGGVLRAAVPHVDLAQLGEVTYWLPPRESVQNPSGRVRLRWDSPTTDFLYGTWEDLKVGFDHPMEVDTTGADVLFIGDWTLELRPAQPAPPPCTDGRVGWEAAGPTPATAALNIRLCGRVGEAGWARVVDPPAGEVRHLAPPG